MAGGTWASGTALNTARKQGMGAGTNDAALIGGGTSPESGKTETWNGSSWTEVNDLNNARGTMAGAGTSTASLAAGGGPGSPPNFSAYTETWNGSSWTEVGDLNAVRRELMGSGATNTAMITARTIVTGKQSNISVGCCFNL